MDYVGESEQTAELITIRSYQSFVAIVAVMYYWSLRSGNSLSIFCVMNLLSQLLRQIRRNWFLRGHVEFKFQSLCISIYACCCLNI
jgi:hypothetical protein